MDDWWRRSTILTLLFLALAGFATLLLFALAGQASNWFGIPAMAAVSGMLLPVALAVLVFQLAGWLERNDERHLIRDEG